MAASEVEPIKSVNEWIQFACDYAEAQTKIENRHLRVWFRGQSDENWPLRPKVFRNLPAKPDADCLKRLWGKESHINREFQSWSANLLPSSKEPLDSYFLQQQYGVPTRFLDWTRNALIALYIATEIAETRVGSLEPNGKLFALDAYRFDAVDVPSVKHGTITIQGFSTSVHPVFKPIVDQLFYWQDKSFPAPVFPVFPRFLDNRMQIQRSTFTYHSPEHPILNRDRNETLREFVVAGERKAEIRRQLTHLGIDEFFVFGDLPSLAKTILANHPLD